jgi:hypothetical protein
MANLPMTYDGGGTNVLTTELVLDLTLGANVTGNTTFIEYSLTEPEAGYVPIAWNVKNYTVESYLSSCNTNFEKKSGVWQLQIKNLNTLNGVSFKGSFRIVWLKE